MNIAGVQGLSLLDYPEKPCSIIFTQGCVFRCAYCHNPELIPLSGAVQMRDPSEVLAFLDDRKGIVDAVCISGGEPTLQRDLEVFIADLKSRGFSVKLDTNGIRPDVIERLISQGLVDYIAMDIKHRWEAYASVIRIASQDMIGRCRETFSLIQSSDVPHEFRTTIFPGVHREEDFFLIAEYLIQGETYYIQDTAFKKNLDPALERERGFELGAMIKKMQGVFPHLCIHQR